MAERTILFMATLGMVVLAAAEAATVLGGLLHRLAELVAGL